MTQSPRLVVPVKVAIRNYIFPNGDYRVSQMGFISIVSGSHLNAFPFLRDESGGHNDEYFMPN
jgi:hypothetical protein